MFGRLIAQKLSDNLGKQFYVENIGGAGGNVGTGRVAKMPPDGYALLVTASPFVVNPTLFDKVPYDPIKGFDAITLAVTTPMVLAVHPAVPANTVKGLVDLIAANPGKYSYASGGRGLPVTLPASNCGYRAVLTLCMSPSIALGWQSAQRSAAIRRSPSLHLRRPSRKYATASSGPSLCWAGQD